MTRATRKMRDLAERLIAHEAKGNKTVRALPLQSFLVVDQLRPHLANLMGSAGFRALLSRSLVLANAEVPWLHAVNVNADGSLAGFVELESQIGPGNFFEGKVVVLAQLLGLLAAFIGEILTLQLVGEIWPNLLINDLDSGKKAEYEKTS